MAMTWKIKDKDDCGVCDCGHEQLFDRKDFVNDNKEAGYKLKEPFQCPQCSKTHDMLMIKPSNSTNVMGCGLIIAVASIAFVFIIYSAIMSSDRTPTYYDTGDPADMTNKEMQEFLDWKEDENRKEWENQKITDN